MRSHSTGTPLVVLGVILFLAAGIGGCNMLLGIGAWGPQQVHETTVNRLYVDISGSGENRKSHYMVGTDAGVFECSNSLLMGIWNTDELYSRLKEGKRFRITTKGRRVVNFLFQEYPYIKAVEVLD
jgi:hypothetical protein